jgi:hypothetical protein
MGLALAASACGVAPAREAASDATERSSAALEEGTVYPTPRFVTYGAAVRTLTGFCVDASALPSHTNLDQVAAELAAEVGLPYNSSCNFTFTFVSTAPALSTSGASAWSAAGSNRERYIVVVRSDGTSSLYAPDERAAIYALTSAQQLVSNATKVLRSAEVVDYPSFTWRAQTLAYYGQGLPMSDMVTVIKLISRSKGNSLVYDQHDDGYVRGEPGQTPNWRTPYPDGSRITPLVQAAARYQIELRWGLNAIDLNFSNYPAELAAAKAKIDNLWGYGVRRFYIGMDDMHITDGTQLGRDHAKFVNDLLAYVKAKDATSTLQFIGPFYAGTCTSGDDNCNYLTEIGRNMDASVPYFVTGNCIFCDTVTLSDPNIVQATRLLGRSPQFWDNKPNVVGEDYVGRAANLSTQISQVMINPCVLEVNWKTYPSTVPQSWAHGYYNILGATNDYLWNPGAYVGREAASRMDWKRRVRTIVAPPVVTWRPANSVTSDNTDRLKVMFRSSSGNGLGEVAQTTPSSSFATSETRLGGVLTHGPLAFRNPDGRAQVVVRGNDGTLWTAYQSTAGGTSWNWALVDGRTDTLGPLAGVLSSHFGNFHFVVRKTNNTLRLVFQKGASASASWTAIDIPTGVLTSRYTMANYAGGQVGLFAVGTDNHLWAVNSTYVGGAFTTNWWRVGGTAYQLAGSPKAAQLEDGRIVIVARSTQNQLIYTVENREPYGPFTHWALVPGAPAVVADPSLSPRADGTLEVAVYNTGGSVARLTTAGESISWSAFQHLGGDTMAGVTPNLARMSNGQMALFIRSPVNNLLFWQKQTNGTWPAAWTSLGITAAEFPGN